MNATAERQIDRTLFEGPVMAVTGALPFSLQIDAERPYVTEPLATELYAPLANFMVVNIMNIISLHGMTECLRKLLVLMAEGQLVRGGIRDLPRSYPGQNPWHRWKMPDENTLIFDVGKKEIRLSKFAEDHFVGFLNYGEHEVWIVRLHDDRDLTI